jgi:hypothetical protein
MSDGSVFQDTAITEELLSVAYDMVFSQILGRQCF